MKLDRLFDSGEPVISFEFYPPKTERGFASLYRTIADLKQLHPAYVSVTWGAGGSTRRKTADLTIQIQRDLNLTAMAHMTCVGSGRTDISQTLDQLQAGGVRNVLALGGDHPDDYKVQAGGFSHANELIEFIRANPNWDLALAGACYPETHTAALSPEADLANLVRKVEAGTDWLITQLFFDNADYFDFVERARAAGIDVPIVAGIMPVVSAENVRRMAELSGAKIPTELAARLDSSQGDSNATLRTGIEWATMQCRELLDRGAPGIHFYTLNRSSATRQVYSSIS